MQRVQMRRHERLLIPDGRNLTAECARPEVKGRVSVIGLGGMFIQTKDLQPYGTVLHLELVDPLVAFEAQCAVRDVAENGLGIEITGITTENEQKLKTLLLHLKP